MAVIALNWELGADLGHVGRLLPIAQALRQRGHDPVFIIRDISRAEPLIGSEGFEYLQAPVWTSAVSGLPDPINFTETLFRFGYLDVPGLMSMCRAWRFLWQRIGADLHVFDQAPTASLAARGLGLPTINVGNSFAIPPQLSPLPRYRFWATGNSDQARMQETEARVTRNSNAVLARLGAPPITQVSELFRVDASFVCCHPALDLYSDRTDERHLGPISRLQQGLEPQWPEADGPRSFSYLKPGYRHFDKVLEALADTVGSHLVFAPGIPERKQRQFTTARLRIASEPFRMHSVMAHCDAILCHAGGMSNLALDHGKPLLLLPMQTEQLMTSVRIANLDAGLHLPTDGNPGKLRALLKRVLGDPALADAARKFAQVRPYGDQEEAIDTIVAACDTLLARGAPVASGASRISAR